MKRHKVGSTVYVLGAEHMSATVLRHGRDANGCYTEVRFPDGSEERYHRDWLKSEVRKSAART